jgi:hypothetical protein
MVFRESKLVAIEPHAFAVGTLIDLHGEELG